MGDLEKLVQGQIALEKFQFAISQQPLEIQTYDWQQWEMIWLCIICLVCDDLKKLAQGQIDLQNVHLAISQQPLMMQTCD